MGVKKDIYKTLLSGKLVNQPHEPRLGRLNNGGTPCDITKLPRCQATAKHSGKRCRLVAMKGKRVCYLHGGKSPGAPSGDRNGNYRNGQHTKAVRAEKRLGVIQVRLFNAYFKGRLEEAINALSEEDARLVSEDFRSNGIET